MPRRAAEKARHEMEDGFRYPPWPLFGLPLSWQGKRFLGGHSQSDKTINAVLRFLPGTIEIGAGSSVTFTNEDINVPHTVTFGIERDGPPGAPPGLIPYGGNVVSSPDQQVNSGFLISQELIDYLNVGGLLPPPPIFTVTRTATFTFPNAGTYHYICALHDELGMEGDVVVRSED